VVDCEGGSGMFPALTGKASSIMYRRESGGYKKKVRERGKKR
jgi:hypothetical protein